MPRGCSVTKTRSTSCEGRKNEELPHSWWTRTEKSRVLTESDDGRGIKNLLGYCNATGSTRRQRGGDGERRPVGRDMRSIEVAQQCHESILAHSLCQQQYELWTKAYRAESCRPVPKRSIRNEWPARNVSTDRTILNQGTRQTSTGVVIGGASRTQGKLVARVIEADREIGAQKPVTS